VETDHGAGDFNRVWRGAGVLVGVEFVVGIATLAPCQPESQWLDTDRRT